MKRGQFEVLETTMLFEVLISLLVAGILFWALFNFGDISFTDEKYIIKDLQQISGFVGSMQGDVEISYPISGIKCSCDEYGCKLTKDEFCKLRIIKKDGKVGYEC
jgi:hypothetical protein